MVFRRTMIAVVFIGLCAVFSGTVYSATVQPSFAEPMSNMTAIVGREAVLECTIENLGANKVAWIKVDTETLIAYLTHVVSRDRRFRITNSNERQWSLHIKDVNVLDRGYYMCQINTEPMISQEGYLDVLVPPSIVEDDTSTDTTVEERAKVSLRCGATGYPVPNVSWRREDSKDINLGPVGNTKNLVQRVEGEFLNLTQVNRTDNGAYLCIAQNGVQPSVSKRIILQVDFPPKIRVANQMVYAAGGTEAVLGCYLEASPTPSTSWIRHDEAVLISNAKYEITETRDSYKYLMQLRIRNVSEQDFGHYKCIAKNIFGEKEGFVRLIEILTTTTTTTMTTLPFKVFYPILRVVTETISTTDRTTFERKELGAPTTNSLRDESHIVSSEKQLGPGKVESHLEDDLLKKRTVVIQSNKSKKSSSGSSYHLLPFSVLSAITFLQSFLFIHLHE